MADQRPLVSAPDLFALLRDALAATAGESFDVWVERERFEPDALAQATHFLMDTWRASGERIETLPLLAFTMGWEVHRELRGEREDLPPLPEGGT